MAAVIGSGKEAVEEACRLAELAEKVYAIPGVKGFTSDTEELQEFVEKGKVEVIEGVDVESIGGADSVTHVTLKSSPPGTIKVDGVFIILENIPTTSIIKEAGILTNESGCILVDKDQQTNISGVFAGGDCVCGGMQIVTAAGEGGRAGLSVLRYIKSLK